MFEKKYNLSVSVEGCKAFKTALNGVLLSLKSFKDKYIYDCLEWVRNASLEYLESDDTFEPSFTVEDIYTGTSLKVENGKGILSYQGDEVLFAEFGTGIVGQETTNHPLANESPQWKYASGEHSGAEDGRWTWKVPDKYQTGEGAEYITFYGYTGKKFIYYAFVDFINYGIYEKKYEIFIKELFDKFL